MNRIFASAPLLWSQQLKPFLFAVAFYFKAYAKKNVKRDKFRNENRVTHTYQRFLIQWLNHIMPLWLFTNWLRILMQHLWLTMRPSMTFVINISRSIDQVMGTSIIWFPARCQGKILSLFNSFWMIPSKKGDNQW